MTQIISLLLIFALPFFIGPIGINFFETPKVYAAFGLIELLTIISLFKLNLKQSLKFSTIDKLLIGLFAFVTIQFIFYPNIFAFYGNEFRRQGVFLLWHLIIFAFITSRACKVRPYQFDGRIKYFKIALIALLLSTFFFGTSVDERAVGVFGEPNSLGIYATFLWPLTGNFLFAIPAFVIILLSGSRSAFIAFGIQCLFLILVKKFSISTKISTAFCLFLIVFSLFLPFFETSAEYQNRPLIWKTAYTAGMQYPLFGWGFGNTENAIKWGANKLENSLRFEYVDASHNILLDWFVQGGMVGVTLLITLIGITINNLIKRHPELDSGSASNPTLGKRQIYHKGTSHFVVSPYQVRHDMFTKYGFLMAFLALLTGLLFNPVSVAILIPFWWIIGVSNQKPVE